MSQSRIWRMGGQHVVTERDRRKLMADLDQVARKLDDWSEVPDKQPEPGEWSEDEQPSSDLEAELQKCKQLRQELHQLEETT